MVSLLITLLVVLLLLFVVKLILGLVNLPPDIERVMWVIVILLVILWFLVNWGAVTPHLLR